MRLNFIKGCAKQGRNDIIKVTDTKVMSIETKINNVSGYKTWVVGGDVYFV